MVVILQDSLDSRRGLVSWFSYFNVEADVRQEMVTTENAVIVVESIHGLLSGVPHPGQLSIRKDWISHVGSGSTRRWTP